MKTRILGKNGFQISEVGLGCWQLGGDWGKNFSHDKGFELLQTAVDNGINFFDTADVYGGGKSEEIIGAFLKQCKVPISVATKFGRGSDAFPDKYSREVLRNSVLASIKRLGLESLDLLQLHCIPTEELRKGDIFEWLREIKNEGLIKQFGASVETVEEGLLCLEQEGLLSLQVIFNIFRQKLVNELLPQAAAKGVGIIVRLPLASGLLSGRFTNDSTFAPSDHRNYNKNGDAFNVGETFAGLPFEKGVELSERLRKNFLPEHLSMVHFALRWILDHPEVSTIIPGASQPSQARMNASVSQIAPLPRELHKALDVFYHNEIAKHIRGAY